MNPFALLLGLFLIIPLVEIYFLIKVGEHIGAAPTVFFVVFTAFLGAWLLRLQGFSTLEKVRRTFDRGGIPALEMLEGIVLLLAGALLLTPGFVTDIFGFLCLIPVLRQWVLLRVINRYIPTGFSQHTSNQPKHHKTIEGEFNREDEDSRRRP